MHKAHLSLAVGTPTSSTALLSPFQLPVSFPALKVLSLKIPMGEGERGEGQSAFQHSTDIGRVVPIETGVWHL